MKHERDIAPRSGWKLKKTLARRLQFRPIGPEDLPYIWAAYRKGALAPMHGAFTRNDMTAQQMREAFEQAIHDRYDREWTMLAETKKGFIPVGMLLAFHQHPVHEVFMIVGDLIWFPWASARNRIESAVNFFNSIRKNTAMVDYAYGEENQRFFEVLCMHGVMRRCGTTFSVVKGKPCAIFETRTG